MTVIETVCANTNVTGMFVLPGRVGGRDVQVLLIKRSIINDGYYVEMARGDGAFGGYVFHNYFKPLTVHSLTRAVGEFSLQ